MWVTCYGCNGSGFFTSCNDKNNKKNYSNEDEKIYCEICNPWGQIINPLLIGQFWVDDNFFPLTPPQSPR